MFSGSSGVFETQCQAVGEGECSSLEGFEGLPQERRALRVRCVEDDDLGLTERFLEPHAVNPAGDVFIVAADTSRRPPVLSHVALDGPAGAGVQEQPQH